jgi:mRNA interferase RelE/StbE
MGLLDVQENRFASLIRTSLKDAETSRSLCAEELTAVALAADEIEKCRMATCKGYQHLETSLGEFWVTGLHPRESQERSFADVGEEFEKTHTSPMLDLSWTIGMSDDFLKSIGSVDKKTQGRILEAISKLSRAPKKPVGDTVKQLTGNLAGLWRYRIGDYRLIYQPDTKSNCVVLIRFTPRGEAYD